MYFFYFFFFNDTATTEIYTLSLHDALPICADIVGRTIVAEDPATVAAIIMEPISISSAGFLVPPREFFTLLREYCDRHDILLIFDEIITGFGRLGTNFGADYYGIVPDLIACGKGMSSGYAPLAAVLIQEKVNREFLGKLEERREFHHGHTYGGNPVACAAGLLQGLELVADRDTGRAFGLEVKPGKLVERAARNRGLIFRCGNEYVA